MILVFCELKDGKIRKASLEALSEARRLSGDAQVGAIFAGVCCEGADEAAKFGADVILTAESPALGAYSSDLFAAVIADAVKAKGATTLLGAATPMGKDMLPKSPPSSAQATPLK